MPENDIFTAADISSAIATLSKIIAGSYQKITGDGDFSIVNRGASDGFAHIFKDAAASYAENTVLCERFFLSTDCHDEVRPFYDAPPEQEAMYREFIDFLNNEEVKKVMDVGDYTAKIQEYQDKLAASPPTITEVPVKVFKDESNGMSYIVQSLSETQVAGFSRITDQVAAFVMMFFTTVNFLGSIRYKIDIMPVSYPKYVDLVAKLTVTL